MCGIESGAYRARLQSLLVAACLATTTAAVVAADDADSRVIVARVVDDAGNPQFDATVTLFGYDEDWRYWRSLDRETRTDENGAARYDGLSKDESYLVRAKTGDNFVGYRQYVLTGDEPQQEADIGVERTMPTSIHVRNQAGEPVAGARLWAIEHTGANGSKSFNWGSLKSIESSIEPSSHSGELRLPELPPGTVDLRLIHPDYAPAAIKKLAVGKESAATVTLDRGVKVTLRFETEGNDPAIDSLMIDFRHEPFKHPSTLIGRLPGVRADGTVELTVAEGKYGWLRLTHPEYAFTPIYSTQYGSTLADETMPFEVRAGNDTFNFRRKPKVKVHGRLIDEKTGQPVAGENVKGELHTGDVGGPFARFAPEWTHIGWGETNEHGEYDLDLAAGRARVSFHGQGKVAKPEHVELDVAPGVRNQVADIRVSPMPKVAGIVLGENGEPVPGIVVRFRGTRLTYAVEPVVTDERGRFELAPPWIPEDLQTHERLPVQTLVAFHSTQPLYAFTEIQLDKPDSLSDVELRLEPQDFESLITRFSGDLTPWQRGIISADREAEAAAISLLGRPAPELDGAHWLNTEKPSMSLADCRGKYVLLQFWTTWCGPCHADMPSLRVLDRLYRDKGLVVIGVHDNSMPLAAIEADVAKEELAYPIVVDHPDGRILARYQEHGVSGFPSYMLIGPDGTVIKDDHTVPGPTLRSFKIEIIRELLMDGGSDTSSN